MVTVGSITSSSATAEWEQVADEVEGYKIELSDDNGASVLSTAGVSTGVLTYNFPDLATDYDYWVRVTAKGADFLPIPSTASVWTHFKTL